MPSSGQGFPLSNLIGIVGIIVLLAIAFLFSNNRKAIKWRIIIGGLVIDVLLAWFIVRTPVGQMIFSFLGKCVDKLMSFSNMGTAFVFGPLYTTSIKASAQTLPPANIAAQLGIKSLANVNFSFSFIFTALVPIIFFGSIMAVLYHYGIMQKIVKGISAFFTRLLGLSSAESIGVASNVFLGQTQAPLVIAPYLKKLSDSELFLTMVGGMATVAGSLLYAYQSMGAYLPFVLAASILAAPGAIIMAKIMFPETEDIANQKLEDVPVETKNGIEAIAVGATDGWKVALGVGVMLLSFLAVVFFINYVVFKATGGHYSLDELVGYAFAPIAYIIGVPDGEVLKFSTLIGQKTIFNEFIAYSNFPTYFPQIVSKGFHSPGIPFAELKTYMMACFALTGFANLSSIAIQIGGIGELVPERKSQIAALGLKALLAAVLANLLSAAIVGVMLY